MTPKTYLNSKGYKVSDSVVNGYDYYIEGVGHFDKESFHKFAAMEGYTSSPEKDIDDAPVANKILFILMFAGIIFAILKSFFL